jgi:photosystem II stability/assembly factor-like uncharacterized protein
MVQRAVFVFLLLLADMSIALASNGVWRSIGPFDGSVNSIAIDAKNSDTVYVGNVAGIFKTTDGGASWSSINPGVYPQVLVVDRQNSQTIFAGTISGILKSVDGGANWHSANLGLGTTPGSQGRPGPYAGVSALTIDPETADILYAATNVGLFKSRDGGASWVDANAGLPTVPVGPGTVRNLPVYLVAIAPRNPTTIYAGGSDVFYMDGRLACCKTALFKSTDGGTTWNTLSLPVPPNLAKLRADVPQFIDCYPYVAHNRGRERTEYLLRPNLGGVREKHRPWRTLDECRSPIEFERLSHRGECGDGLCGGLDLFE